MVGKDTKIEETRGLRRLAALWEFSIVGVETGKMARGPRERQGEQEGHGKGFGCARLSKLHSADQRFSSWGDSSPSGVVCQMVAQLSSRWNCLVANVIKILSKGWN